MGHKTMIGGTTYEAKGGKTLVDGTAYSIAKGRTLVDGTGYDISIKKTYTVTIVITRNAGNRAYVTIGGTKYTSGAAVEVEPGTVITMGITVNLSWTQFDITVDGTSLYSGRLFTATQEATHVVAGDMTITIDDSNAFNGSASITGQTT